VSSVVEHFGPQCNDAYAVKMPFERKL